MRTVTIVVLIIATVLLTSVVWYIIDVNRNASSQINIYSPETQTSQPTTLVPSQTGSTMSPLPSTTQSIITKPSVPNFTIEVVDNSYDVKTTYTTDPYTGQTITHPGYHVDNKTTQIKITNQAFTPYQVTINGQNWTINLFYNIHIKGHFSPDWMFYRLHNGSSDGNLVQKYDSQYTIVSINDYLPSEGQIDIQIQALAGYEQGIVTVPGAPGTSRVITGESSDWSSTQTIKIP